MNCQSLCDLPAGQTLNTAEQSPDLGHRKGAVGYTSKTFQNSYPHLCTGLVSPSEQCQGLECVWRCRLTPWRHAATELRQLSASPFRSQERAGPHVAPSTSACPTRRPTGVVCVGRRGSVQHAHGCAGWRLTSGSSLFHAFSCFCSNLQGHELRSGFGGFREFF